MAIIWASSQNLQNVSNYLIIELFSESFKSARALRIFQKRVFQFKKGGRVTYVWFGLDSILIVPSLLEICITLP